MFHKKRMPEYEINTVTRTFPYISSTVRFINFFIEIYVLV